MSARRNEGGEVFSLHHLQVAMPAGEEDVARAFYGGLLGLDEVPKPPQLAKRGGCWFKGPALELHLGVEAEFRPARKAHPAFRVDGLLPLRQRLERSGVEIVDDTQLDGHRRFYAFDPFGNRLEFIEEHAAGG
jgi:catechol 2,3-dioxygenase-like lactoylglutathione lyase family enzyme